MSEAACLLWESLGDQLAQARNLVRRCEIVYAADLFRRHEVADMAEQARKLLEARGPSAELAIARTWQGFMLGRREPKRALACLAEAKAIGEQIGDDAALVEILSRCSLLEVNLLGAPTERTIARLFEVSKARGFDHGIVSAYRASAQAAAWSSDLGAAERWIGEGLRFADNRQVDQYLHTHILKVYGVELDQLRGGWAAAGGNFQKLIQTGHAHWSVRMIMLRLRVCPMYIRAGRDEGKQWLEEALAVEDKLTPIEAYSLHRALVEYHWRAGDLDAARRSAHDLRSAGWGADHPWIRGDTALCAWITGERDRAPENIAEPHALLISGDWRAAASAWKRLDCPYEAGFALIFGDEDAQREALRIFEMLGAHATVEYLRSRMRSEGVKGIPTAPRASTKENPAGLTDRETEVPDLLAQGLSNAAIAGRLHRSIRTVEHHVATLAGKLGADSRQGAVVIARKRGLLAD